MTLNLNETRKNRNRDPLRFIADGFHAIINHIVTTYASLLSRVFLAKENSARTSFFSGMVFLSACSRETPSKNYLVSHRLPTSQFLVL